MNYLNNNLNDNPSLYRLTDEDFDVPNKINKFLTRVYKKLHTATTSNNKSIYNNNNVYLYDKNDVMKSVAVFEESYLKSKKGNTNLIDDNGKIKKLNNKAYDFSAFKRDFFRDGHSTNIFIKHGKNYYQINYKYLYTEFKNNLPPNNEEKTYLIYETFFNVMLKLLKKNNIIQYTTDTTDTNVKNKINRIITSLYILMSQSYMADFISRYYQKLYDTDVSQLNVYYNNYIIDINTYSVYKLNNIRFQITNTEYNTNFASANIDMCHKYNKCLYHVIKAYINTQNELTFSVFTLSDNTLFKFDYTANTIQLNTLPTMQFDKDLLLYTKYSNYKYLHNPHINALSNKILFIDL